MGGIPQLVLGVSQAIYKGLWATMATVSPLASELSEERAQGVKCLDSLVLGAMKISGPKMWKYHVMPEFHATILSPMITLFGPQTFYSA